MNRPACIILSLLPAVLAAQTAISPRAGLIHHIEGRALLDGERITTKSAHFSFIGEGQTLSTERGRAEIVLAPGRILRTSRDTAFELLSDDITDVRLRLIRGSAILDFSEGSGNGSVSLLLDDSEITLRKRGRYRLDAPPGDSPRLRVFEGKALVSMGGRRYDVKSKRLLALNGAAARPDKFDVKQVDSFDRWNEQRSRRINREARKKSRRSVKRGGRRGKMSAARRRPPKSLAGPRRRRSP